MIVEALGGNVNGRLILRFCCSKIVVVVRLVNVCQLLLQIFAIAEVHLFNPVHP
jgi:hypothetical protein